MKHFEFQIYGTELDDYCFSLVEKYGEESKIVQLLDKNYDRLIKESSVFVDQLNAIREFLYDNGFEKEISEQDAVFLEEVSKRPRKKRIPLSERWKHDKMS